MPELYWACHLASGTHPMEPCRLEAGGGGEHLPHLIAGWASGKPRPVRLAGRRMGLLASPPPGRLPCPGAPKWCPGL